MSGSGRRLDAPPPTGSADGAAPGARRAALGWVALAGEVAYLVALHRGVGPAPTRVVPQWWHPTGAWLGWGWLADLAETPAAAIAVLALPAAALAGAVIAGTRSALARWISLSGVVTALLFGFYGVVASRVWEFFGLRGSWVMVSIGLAVGAALASPWLAASGLRRRSGWAAAAYAVAGLGVVALLRHTTGTDESLAFNFSPWPAVTIFGLEIGAYAVAGALFGLALAVWGLAEWPGRRWTAVGAVGVGAVLPWIWIESRFGSPPDAWVAPLAVGMAAAIAIAGWRPPGGRPDGLRRRAFHLAVGASLVTLPLFVGRALSTADYTVTRFVRAQEIIDALGTYYREHDGYPDDLDTLVRLDYLDEIPRPRLGFGWMVDLDLAQPSSFSYQSLGSSYVLEFDFTEWVQCAYNPPWEDEEEDDGEESLGEAWSCPASRPELW